MCLRALVETKKKRKAKRVRIQIGYFLKPKTWKISSFSPSAFVYSPPSPLLPNGKHFPSASCLLSITLSLPPLLPSFLFPSFLSRADSTWGKRPPADQVGNQPTAVCTLSPVAFNYSLTSLPPPPSSSSPPSSRLHSALFISPCRRCLYFLVLFFSFLPPHRDWMSASAASFTPVILLLSCCFPLLLHLLHTPLTITPSFCPTTTPYDCISPTAL